MGYESPRIPREHNKYHEYTVRGTPNCPLIVIIMTLQGGPPTSYKWSYKPYKWPYKWVTGVITILIGVITPLITGRGPPCSQQPKARALNHWPQFISQSGYLYREGYVFLFRAASRSPLHLSCEQNDLALDIQTPPEKVWLDPQKTIPKITKPKEVFAWMSSVGEMMIFNVPETTWMCFFAR